jgi:ribonuclease R
LIKAASKEYYEGKIDMTGRKTAYFVCAELETMFLFQLTI